MGAYLPGPAGFAVLAAVKFGGYVVAGVTLRKLQPAITAGVMKIAATRTGLGILLGPPLALVLLAFGHMPGKNPVIFIYFLLFFLRLLIWALLLVLFTRRLRLPQSTFWLYAGAGAVWSCLLDLPGFGLAIITPGQIVIC